MTTYTTDATTEVIPSDPVVEHPATALLSTKLTHVTVAGSLVEGNAVPDMVIAASFPEILPFTASITGEALDAHILAYLRAVRGGVRLSTIAERVNQSEETVEKHVQKMVDAEAIRLAGGLYYIAYAWRHILPEIVAINVPDINGSADAESGDGWRAAAEQAARNRIFAHRTFIALPERIAQTVEKDPIFHDSAVGLLAIPEGSQDAASLDDVALTLKVNSLRLIPTSWLHYYSVVLNLARRF